MGWTDHAILWHVYALGFVGAERGALPAGALPIHRLGRVVDWLDYVAELGCNGLLIGPLFASETHGYDTVDPFRIDARLGTDEDFDRLVAAAGARGIRLVLDGVFHHVGRGFPPFAEASRSGPGGAAARWFRWQRGGWATFEGHQQLIALDHGSEVVAEHVTRVMRHWLDRGASGWRLDAAYAVPPAFWRRVLSEVRQSHPDAWFVGEVIRGDYAAYVRDSGVDAITQYELWKAVWSALNDRNLFELTWALERHNGFGTPLTFVGNHDVTRLASKLSRPEHIGHALAVLFTVAGVPCVYAGDEQAFRGIKEDRVGGDDAIRPAFPDAPSGLAPYGWPTYRTHQRLIGLRRRHPWLLRARTRVEHLTNRAAAIRTVGEGGQSLLVLLNVDDVPFRFPLTTGERVLESAEPGAVPDDPLLVPPHAWAILGAPA